jgi:hypothetical protein
MSPDSAESTAVDQALDSAPEAASGDGSGQDDVGSLRREAAGYRSRLRAAEAERDTLAEQVTGYQRSAAEGWPPAAAVGNSTPARTCGPAASSCRSCWTRPAPSTRAGRRPLLTRCSLLGLIGALGNLRLTAAPGIPVRRRSRSARSCSSGKQLFGRRLPSVGGCRHFARGARDQRLAWTLPGDERREGLPHVLVRVGCGAALRADQPHARRG